MKHLALDWGLAALAVVTAVALGGCVTTAAEWPPAPSALLAVPVEASEARPVEAFNQEVASAAQAGMEWPNHPRMVVQKFAQWGNERASVVALSGPGESPSIYEVIAINDGFTGDSVRGERLDLTLERAEDGTWRVTSANASQRCWEGRGHENFSTAPCS